MGKRRRINQHELNKQIETFILEKDKQGQSFSPEDIAFIQQYEGSGGQGSKGASGEGVLYEFFVPEYLAGLMWQLAFKHGYKDGHVLEPSCATGRLIKDAPDKGKVVGFEINEVSARIAEITYPEATIYRQYFETAFLNPPKYRMRLPGFQTWLKEYPFDLVIGNPPYGKYRNFYSSYFPKPKFPQIEIFFMYYGLRLLRKGGVLIYLTSSNFLRNGNTFDKSKEAIGQIAELAEAFRLPPVFRFSQVPTDIIVFKRK